MIAFPRSIGLEAFHGVNTDWVESIEKYRKRTYLRVVAPADPRGNRDARRDDLDLDALIQELTDSVKPEAEGSGVACRVEVARDLAHVTPDRVQLRNVLLEMVHEALHGLALGQLEARELVARIALTAEQEIEICVGLRR
jgi:C4-dicarboxylate-specific signal transduction histidine kinase